ncbi:hypothetical protein CGRA01v4_07270 [Colletotrichum graminicola]|nr:hypothetical protein CGRA01v4_07270 [Colletotrichum graminicola]
MLERERCFTDPTSPSRAHLLWAAKVGRQLAAACPYAVAPPSPQLTPVPNMAAVSELQLAAHGPD